jgi:hypothetical protein
MPSVPDTLEWRGCKFSHQGDWTYRWEKQDDHPEFRISVISSLCLKTAELALFLFISSEKACLVKPEAPLLRQSLISTIHGPAGPLEWTARAGYGSSPSLKSPLAALDFALERHLERLEELEETVAKARKVTDRLLQSRST